MVSWHWIVGCLLDSLVFCWMWMHMRWMGMGWGPQESTYCRYFTLDWMTDWTVTVFEYDALTLERES